jgi:hypothetical protein
MSIVTRTTALIGAGAILAVPAAVLVSSPAHADVERRGICGNGAYELSVDREGRGFEVDAEVDSVTPGSRWRITLTHDGKRFYRNVLRAAHEGELDVDRHRPNTAGKDTFTFRAKHLGSDTVCRARITVR